MKYISIALTLLALTSGCRSAAYKRQILHEKAVAIEKKEPTLRVDQIEYLIRYDKRRHWLVNFLRQPDRITVEAFRPHVAGFLEMKKDSTLEDITVELERRNFLSEGRRLKIVLLFELPLNASWADILLHLEKLRKKLY